jgi:hypothetical protein
MGLLFHYVCMPFCPPPPTYLVKHLTNLNETRRDTMLLWSFRIDTGAVQTNEVGAELAPFA